MQYLSFMYFYLLNLATVVSKHQLQDPTYDTSYHLRKCYAVFPRQILHYSL